MGNKNQSQADAFKEQLNAATDLASASAVALLAISALAGVSDQLAAALVKSQQLEAELDEAAKLNGELQEQVEVAKNGGAIIPSFKTGKDKYNVLHGVNLDGKVYSAEDIAQNVKVQKQLIASQSGAISKVADEVTE